MKSTYTAVACGFFLTLALAGPVAADSMSEDAVGASRGPGFFTLDTDGNGYLSKSEAENRSGLVNKWAQADSNKDGRIDSTEFAAFEITEGSTPSAPAQNSPESGGSSSPSGMY